MCPLLATCLLAAALPGSAPVVEIDDLGAWPQTAELHAPIAGRSGSHLIVAGGMRTDGADTTWSDTARVFDLEGGTWQTPSNGLPRPIARAVSLTHPKHGIVVAGGSDGIRHHDEVFLLRHVDGRLEYESLPDLPDGCAEAAGVLLGDMVCIAGGRNAPESNTASDRLWTLDLGASPHAWIERTPLPDGGRHHAVAATDGTRLLLIGGSGLDAGRSMSRSDVWAWTPETDDWERLADLPQPISAAPSPAFPAGHDGLVVLTGSDELLVYSPITDTWRHGTVGSDTASDDPMRSDVPGWPAAGTPTVPFAGGTIVPAGIHGPDGDAGRLIMLRPILPNGQLASLDWIVIAIYLLALVAMGFYFTGREQGTDDFFLAGQRIPWWAAGISIFATGLSAITFMAIPAKAYQSDWVFFIMNLGVIVLAPIIIYVFLPFYRRLGLTTAYEYLERRFGLSVRLLGSGQFILAQLGRVAVVVFLPALALSAVTGIDVILCIALMGLLAIIYTVLGGIEVVIWSDVLQAVILMGGALLAGWIMIDGIPGGLAAAIESASERGKLTMVNTGFDWTQPVLAVVILGALFNNIIPYTSDQAVIQRYLTTPDERSARFAIWTGALLSIPSGIVFFGLGTLLWAWYRANPQEMVPLGAVDQILPWFIVTELPTGVAGLIIAAIFAAAMSSIDSSMNSVSTAWTTDFHRRFRPDIDDRQALRVARWTTVVFGVCGTGAAILIASLDIKSVLDLWFKILGLFASGLCGLFILGIFTRRPGTAAAISGLAISAIVNFIIGTWTDVNVLLIACFGITSCVLTGLLVGFIRPARADLTGLTLHSPPSPSP
ncbi:MAG: sodium/solute symporter [Phycisphaerales bacterium]|nr:sodium/solute symporter [Phycisphaerales bacterium]